MFNRAYADLGISADFKTQLADFIVEEELGFEPSGVGEHVFLWVEKQGLTTERLIGDIARIFDVSRKQIGLCGLKDKQGITRQWLSVSVPIKQDLPKLTALQGNGWYVLAAKRHDRKLKRGVHTANHFTLTLRNIDYGQSSQEALEQRFQLLAKQGVPHYFGPQRFGFNGQNMHKAQAIFDGQLKLKPAQRGIYYSAARSYLFNHYLSERISQKNWNVAVEGDVMMLEGSHSIFKLEKGEALSHDLQQRMIYLDCHPVGVLGGKGFGLSGAAADIFKPISLQYSELEQGLLDAGLNSAFRALRLLPKALNWFFYDNHCELTFSLTSGAYATALLHECVTTRNAHW